MDKRFSRRGLVDIFLAGSAAFLAACTTTLERRAPEDYGLRLFNAFNTFHPPTVAATRLFISRDLGLHAAIQNPGLEQYSAAGHNSLVYNVTIMGSLPDDISDYNYYLVVTDNNRMADPYVQEVLSRLGTPILHEQQTRYWISNAGLVEFSVDPLHVPGFTLWPRGVWDPLDLVRMPGFESIPELEDMRMSADVLIRDAGRPNGEFKPDTFLSVSYWDAGCTRRAPTDIYWTCISIPQDSTPPRRLHAYYLGPIDHASTDGIREMGRYLSGLGIPKASAIAMSEARDALTRWKASPHSDSETWFSVDNVSGNIVVRGTSPGSVVLDFWICDRMYDSYFIRKHPSCQIRFP